MRENNDIAAKNAYRILGNTNELRKTSSFIYISLSYGPAINNKNKYYRKQKLHVIREHVLYI